MPVTIQQLFNNESFVTQAEFILLGYKHNSKGMRALQTALLASGSRARRKRLVDFPSAFFGSTTLEGTNLVINWGNSSGFSCYPKRNLLVLNGNRRVMDTTSNKKLFFSRFYSPDGIISLPYPFFDLQDAINYMGVMSRDTSSSTSPVLVERMVLNGHGGDGIRLLYRGDAPSASGKLWTKYIKKTDEYRIHFFKGIDRLIVQRKGLLNGTVTDEATFRIRNRDRGWVYCRQNVNAPLPVMQQATNFMNSPKNGLDFGAIDIIYSRTTGLAHILEVNTAPGVEGTTVEDYVFAFKEYVRQHDFTRSNEDNSFKKRYQADE